MPSVVMLADAAVEGTTSGGGIGVIVTAVGDVVSLVPKVYDMITGNPLLLFFTAVGVLGAVFGLFAHLKHVAKN